jgi:hypothetical protein
VVPDFLAPEHTERLSAAFDELVSRRRQLHAAGVDPLGRTQNGDTFPAEGEQGPTRVFSLLHEDEAFIALLEHPPALAFVHALLNTQPHLHSTDGYHDVVDGDPGAAPGWSSYGTGWHIDGILSGFRELGPRGSGGSSTPAIPLLQLKLAYYLSDLSEPDQGNLTVIPGSHIASVEPTPEGLEADAKQLCGKPGTLILFHNATYHTAGPMRRTDGRRTLLYYGAAPADCSVNAVVTAPLAEPSQTIVSAGTERNTGLGSNTRQTECVTLD